MNAFLPSYVQPYSYLVTEGHSHKGSDVRGNKAIHEGLFKMQHAGTLSGKHFLFNSGTALFAIVPFCCCQEQQFANLAWQPPPPCISHTFRSDSSPHLSYVLLSCQQDLLRHCSSAFLYTTTNAALG